MIPRVLAGRPPDQERAFFVHVYIRGQDSHPGEAEVVKHLVLAGVAVSCPDAKPHEVDVVSMQGLLCVDDLIPNRDSFPGLESERTLVVVGVPEGLLEAAKQCVLLAGDAYSRHTSTFRV